MFEIKNENYKQCVSLYDMFIVQNQRNYLTVLPC